MNGSVSLQQKTEGFFKKEKSRINNRDVPFQLCKHSPLKNVHKNIAASMLHAGQTYGVQQASLDIIRQAMSRRHTTSTYKTINTVKMNKSKQ